MKNLITIINLFIIIAITSIFTQSDEGKKKTSRTNSRGNVAISHIESSNTIKSDFAIWSAPADVNSVSNEADVEFIKEMTEARIMDLEQGKSAEQRASSRPLKDYGSLMVKDQSKMLDELKKLADLKNVSISSGLGSDKAEALGDLRKVHGSSFDKKFIKMMILDHKRDVKKLERATRSGDADIKVFATKYLPVVQVHLDRIKALKKGN